MKIDLSPRQSGRTTRMIEWLREKPDRILLTHSHKEELRLKRDYPDVSERIIDWQSYQRAMMGRTSRMFECAMDDAELFLQHHFGRLTRIAITDDLESPNTSAQGEEK